MKSDDVRAANLADLEYRYREPWPALAEAAEFLMEHRGEPRFLKRVLRDHTVRPIRSAAEIRRRDAVDELLDYYSLLELGSLVRFIPSPLPRRLAGEIKRCIGTIPVRDYYEKHYPLILPQSLYLRVTGEHDLAERRTKAGSRAFLEFLGLLNEVEGDDDVNALMAFMDDYVTGGYSWVDLRSILVDPNSYTEAMCTEPGKQTVLHSAVHGFRKFLEFAADFDRFLEKLHDVPLFRSGAWHYFSYWFDHIEDRIGPVLDQILLNTLNAGVEHIDASAVQEIRGGAALQRSQLMRLFFSEYQNVLPDRLSIAWQPSSPETARQTPSHIVPMRRVAEGQIGSRIELPELSIPVLNSQGGYQSIQFRLDPRLSTSVLPFRFARVLGIKPPDVKQAVRVQVSGRSVQAHRHRFTINLCGIQAVIPCLIPVENEDDPMWRQCQLGLTGVVDVFDIRITESHLEIRPSSGHERTTHAFMMEEAAI